MSFSIWAMETMMAASQENWIKHRAYQLWEQEGYPSGKDMEHWERAKLEYATLKPTAGETDAPKKGAAVKAPKAAEAKPAKAGPAKTTATKTTKTAAPKAEKKTDKPTTAAKADAKAKVPAAAAAVKPEQTKKRPKKADAE
ncbi:DUF2934 domain-containing protein [Aliirhizobium cellulosilyticum]|jgi:hypothetical protein|uniref:DUF2934 domain-containing protein n=2 Tax=Aliirhizobium cellulosilyticum TaxID=393664 RepID=A0A7W6UWR5_9HYPH|nr:DUF2934 domain-containing protein [Rhizobium cellulosilyticum]MBB4346526.1 hypothetical protein [Rhizobium cellulosilyticum]MBB4445769.1 hypothetical protein [Rhizobium cellulosilyticum]